MLLEMLFESVFSYSIAELSMTSAMTNTSKIRTLLLPTLPLSCTIAHTTETGTTDHTSLMSAFIAATKTDLKQLKDKNKQQVYYEIYCNIDKPI